MKLITLCLVPLVSLAVLVPAPVSAFSAPADPPAVPLVTQTLALSEPTSLSSRWTRIQRLRYGPATDQLGTSPGGEAVLWGPDYGVQVPDKTWWYADAAKLRLAHFSDSGHYLGQVRLPAKYLNQGIYFQWDNPIALADGTVVLSSTTIDSPGLLLLSPRRKLSRVALDTFVSVLVTDGTRLYGFSEQGAKVRVNPRTGAVTPVSRFKGQGGRSFDVSVGTGYIAVTRPGVNLRLNLVDPAHPTTPVHPSVEVVMGATGKLWVLATGIVEVSLEEVYEVGGLFNVDTDGSVSAVSRIRTWYSEADPGDGRHLGMRYGGTHPTLMFIDTDAVRVYRKK